MTFKAKLLLALGTFAIVAVIGIVQYIGRSTNTPTTANNKNTTNTAATNTDTDSAVVTPKPSSDINAVVDALVTGASAESTQIAGETVDEASVTGDSQNLQTYSQSYDEAEF